jgi:hypothetical protein
VKLLGLTYHKTAGWRLQDVHWWLAPPQNAARAQFFLGVFVRHFGPSPPLQLIQPFQTQIGGTPRNANGFIRPSPIFSIPPHTYGVVSTFTCQTLGLSCLFAVCSVCFKSLYTKLDSDFIGSNEAAVIVPFWTSQGLSPLLPRPVYIAPIDHNYSAIKSFLSIL